MTDHNRLRANRKLHHHICKASASSTAARRATSMQYPKPYRTVDSIPRKNSPRTPPSCRSPPPRPPTAARPRGGIPLATIPSSKRKKLPHRPARQPCLLPTGVPAQYQYQGYPRNFLSRESNRNLIASAPPDTLSSAITSSSCPSSENKLCTFVVSFASFDFRLCGFTRLTSR